MFHPYPSRAVLFFVLFLIPHFLQAQHRLKGQITGPDGLGISHAIVLLYHSGDTAKVLQASVPDTSGSYQMLLPEEGPLSVRVSAMGFETVNRELIQASDTVIIADFRLPEDKKGLNEVVINGSKPIIERKVDRTVFNVGNSISSAGGNALDALKRTPGVIVNQKDYSISLAGKSVVYVLVNDRLMQLSGEDLLAYLQAVPSDNLEKIEVITAPPARYDAGGNAGLINIVLKKNSKAGMNGEARLGYEQAFYGRRIAGGNINYRNGKWNFYGSAGYNKGANDIVERLNTDYPVQQFRLVDNYKRTRGNVQYNAGVDYALHKQGVLGIDFSGLRLSRDDDESIWLKALNRASGNPDSLMLTTSFQRSEGRQDALNLNYTWNIDSLGRKLSLNANRLWYTSKRNKDFGTQNYEADMETPTGLQRNNRSKGNQQIRISTLQADLEWPLQDWKLSAGGKLSIVDNTSRNKFFDVISGNYVENAAISNAFDYKEKVQALYGQVQRSVGRWDLQLGLRAEFTQTEGYSHVLQQANNNRYFKLFPSAYLQYKASDRHTFNINYSRRINRPAYNELDPFRSYSSPYSYIEGNPFLQPSFNHNVEATYTLDSRFSFTAFYQFEQDHFGQVMFLDTLHSSLYTKRDNFGNSSTLGISGQATLSPFPWWEIQLSASGIVQKITSDYYYGQALAYRLPAVYLSSNNSFVLNTARTLMAEINVYYMSENQSEFWRFRPAGSLDGGIKALFFKKKLVLALNVNDILATQRGRGVYMVTGQTINNYFDTRNLRLVLSYRFGNKGIKARTEKKTGIEEERGRVR
jgi:outer membrane receptor protein involved in Fe transport